MADAAPAKAAVAICVRTYERSEFLRRTIAGVLAQTFEDWTISIFNNGGDPQRVDDVVAEFGTALDGKMVVTHWPQRIEISEAATRSAAATASDYVVVHDDDDDWEPTFLERTTGLLSQLGDEVVAVATQALWIEERKEPSGDWTVIGTNDTAYEFLAAITLETAVVRCPVPPICLLIRRSAWDAVGGYEFELGHSSDWFTILRLLAIGRIELIPELLARYYLHAAENGAARNISLAEGAHDHSDLVMRDVLSRRQLVHDEVDLGRVIGSISAVDRENHAMLEQALEHLWTIRVDADHVRHRLAHLEDRVDRLDPAGRRFWRDLRRRIFRRNG